jgi:hypothetical protein
MKTGIPQNIVSAFLLGSWAALGALAVEAQGPLRQQEIRVPGLDVVLKAGWQLLFDQSCRFAVPVSWHLIWDSGFVRAPDGSSLTIMVLRGIGWSAHKAQIRAAYVHLNVVHEDSDRRLWFEVGEEPRVQHYIAVSGGSTICAGLLDIRSNTLPDREDTIKRIADSIGLAPEKRRPD